MRFWLDDRIVDEGEARVSVLDRGFLIGDAVFDTTTAVSDGEGRIVPFALDRHVSRLVANASAIGLEMPAERVRAAMLAACDANPDLVAGARFRATISTGRGGPADVPKAEDAVLVVVVSNEPGNPRGEPAAAVSPWPVSSAGALAGVKSTSFGAYARALRWAIRLGADEAILGSTEGLLVEGSTSNVFVVAEGKLVTPGLESGCLPGITRELLLLWARQAQIDTVEPALPMSALEHIDELLITSAVRGVQPIHALLDASGTPIWRPSSSEMGRRLLRLYAERRAAGWNP